MEKTLLESFPLLGVESDCILSKQGDITIGYRVLLSEIFTISNDEYEAFHQAWVKAIRLLPKHVVFHKQDWFEGASYQPDASANDSFLNQAAARHFAGRPYLKHTCYIFLTQKPKGRKPASSVFSNLIKTKLAPDVTLSQEQHEKFLDSCGQFQSVLEDSGLVKMERLTATDLVSQQRRTGIIEKYCYLSGTDNDLLVRDMQFGSDIKIGNKHCQLYSLGDAADLPSLCGSRINYEKLSTDRTKFPIGFASPLGHLLPYDHLYSQYIFIDDAQMTIKKLESKRLRLQSLSAYSRENLIARDAVNDFLNEAISDQRLPVKAHFNVLVWTQQPGQLKDIRNKVGAALAQMDAVAKEESAGSAQIYWAGIPGNAAEFPMNDTFDTFLEQATCFLSYEGEAKSVRPDEGIRFCDRLSRRPVFFDPYHLPRKQGISSNMGTLVCGSSGAGKSMVVNHILRTLYDQGAHCVIVDIGGSYRGLCDLVKGYYFTYTEASPIKFNPFYLPKGQVLDTEKKESLKSLLVALWKQDDEAFNRSEYVALSNALAGYYGLLKEQLSLFPCFDSFYEYLQGDYAAILEGQKVKEKDFDLSNFLYVLRPYYRGGEFDFLLNATENLDIFHQRFCVFEIDNLKDHGILFPVCTLIICELFISKIRNLPGILKVLCIDEAWKAIAKSGMAEYIRYAFKTFRKFNGVPVVVTQELDDLVSSPIIKDAIINNSDVKILLDMRKFLHKFDKLQDTLGLSEKGKTILLSVNKDERELFIDVGGQIQQVFKNELCPEEYYAYTTEGKERVKVIEFAERYGSMEAGITALVRVQHRA